MFYMYIRLVYVGVHKCVLAHTHSLCHEAEKSLESKAKLTITLSFFKKFLGKKVTLVSIFHG